MKSIGATAALAASGLLPSMTCAEPSASANGKLRVGLIGAGNRYPFRSGIYEFEYHNNNAEHCRPTLPESMADLGYQTTHIGKLGVREKTIKGNWASAHPIYQQSFDFKDLAKDALCERGKDWITQINGVKFDKPFQSLEFFVTPEGKFEYCSLELEKVMPQFAGTAARTMDKYDLLRHYNKKKGKHVDSGMILAGLSPREAEKIRRSITCRPIQRK